MAVILYVVIIRHPVDCFIIANRKCSAWQWDPNTALYQQLAEYVYSSVFDQDKVYPDMLLRDYARLIIERFLYEVPRYSGAINRCNIIPPYSSDPIPEVPDGHYHTKNYDGGEFWLMQSMRFENMGMYGDFGRYIYQSALKDFDVDLYQIFNYSVHHIFHDLGYTEKDFGDYDCNCCGHGRQRIVQTERIGKKYQWITMMEVLARVADHCNMAVRWDSPEETDAVYEGAWEPFVRNFDPTLNRSFMHCDTAPVFGVLDSLSCNAMKENTQTNFISDEQKIKWLISRGSFLDGLKDTLILKETDGTEWVSLTCYQDADHGKIYHDKTNVWGWLYAYFVTPEQQREFICCADKGISVITGVTRSDCQTYKVYNREYPWAPSCKDLKDEVWLDVSLPTGEYEKVTENNTEPDLHRLNELIAQYGGNSENDASGINELSAGGDAAAWEQSTSQKVVTRQREVEKYIGKVLRASCNLLWEAEYDASKEEAISCNVPCPQLCEFLHLKQLDADGFYFDDGDKLAAFDVTYTQGFNRLLIRRDLLDRFLAENSLQLIWLADTQKEIFSSDIQISDSSEWQAVYCYGENGITRDLKLRGGYGLADIREAQADYIR